jgi:hypothetical protein
MDSTADRTSTDTVYSRYLAYTGEIDSLAPTDSADGINILHEYIFQDLSRID